MSKIQKDDGRFPSGLLTQLFVQPEAAKAIKSAKEKGANGGKKRRRADRFFRMTPAFCLKLCEEKVPWTVWAMVCALYEAWYASGWYDQHPNPFPLGMVDVSKWGLHRRQKSRAMQVLIRAHLVKVDQTDPKHPLVTLAWEPKCSP